MADKWPWLRNAPIVEGLLDIQFVPLPQERLPDLQALKTELPDYPNVTSKIVFAGQIALSGVGPANLSQQSGIIGYQYTTADSKRVFQARLNGVTLSFLAPYPKFTDLQAEAQRLWGIFAAKIGPTPITRVALRYINKLELALPFADFSEYIRTVPEVAPTLPQQLSAYQMRLVLPDSESNAQSIITESFEGLSQDQKDATVYLDIDVFHNASATEPLSVEQLWATVLELRDFKNRIFFGTITDRLKERYQ
jgi:uncharacterized protein (TIGR04255 family)